LQISFFAHRYPPLEGQGEELNYICPGRTGFFLLTAKETKLPAENFSFEVSDLA